MSPRAEMVVLGNGLTVYVCENRDQPLVAVSLRYRVGSCDEEPGRTGFAHLFEHLMFSGSANVGRGEHMQAIQSLGATCNATTSADWTNYFSVALADDLDLILWLEADRLASLAGHVDQAALDAERNVVINERLQTVDNAPYGTVTEQLLSSFFPPGHPYGHAPIGSIADLQVAAVADVAIFFERHYVPNRLVLGVAGNVTASGAFELVHKHLGHLPPAPTATGKEWGLADEIRDRRRWLPGVRDGLPPRLFIGCLLPPTHDALFEASRVAASALARGEGSLLLQSLVAERGIAADVKVRMMPLAHQASLGIVEIIPRDGTAPAKIAETYFAEVEAAYADGISAAQFERTLAQHQAHWCGRFDSVAGQADEMTWHAVMAEPSASGHEHPLRILNDFSPEDLQHGFAPWAGGTGARLLLHGADSGEAGYHQQAGGW